MSSTDDDSGFVARSRRDIRQEENDVRAELVERLLPLAEDLVTWEPGALGLLPLEETQLEAILVYRKTSGRRGKSRQMQYIVAVLLANAEELLAATGEGGEPSIVDVATEDVAAAHLAMVTGVKDAVEDALDRWPDLERQKLRQLARAASKEKRTIPLRESSRKLLTYLEEAAGLIG